MIVDEYATPDEWPRKGRGGWWRNFNDQALVSHPNGGKRKLAYDGASSVWPFQKPYNGDPIHGLRGTAIHDLCDMADRGQPLTDGDYATAAELGISEELANYIYARWLTFRKEHRITTIAIEQPYVNDTLKVASNADRIDNVAGVVMYGDIKTARNAIKVDYLVQLATIAGSLPYDQEADERGTWDDVTNRQGNDGDQ